MGDVWAGPYLALEPATCWVAVEGGAVVGYVIGTPDTRRYEAACEAGWWPRLRQRYVAPQLDVTDPRGWTLDQRLRHLVHHPPCSPDDVVAGHPAHLHLNLLPVAQGRGIGKALLTEALGGLAAQGAPGVHVGVSPTNRAGPPVLDPRWLRAGPAGPGCRLAGPPGRLSRPAASSSATRSARCSAGASRPGAGKSSRFSAELTSARWL